MPPIRPRPSSKNESSKSKGISSYDVAKAAADKDKDDKKKKLPKVDADWTSITTTDGDMFSTRMRQFFNPKAKLDASQVQDRRNETKEDERKRDIERRNRPANTDAYDEWKKNQKNRWTKPGDPYPGKKLKPKENPGPPKKIPEYNKIPFRFDRWPGGTYPNGGDPQHRDFSHMQARILQEKYRAGHENPLWKSDRAQEKEREKRGIK